VGAGAAGTDVRATFTEDEGGALSRKLIHVVALLVIVGMLSLGGSAHAACPENDPDCDPGGGVTTITRTLHVVDSSQATVTATGINCGVAGDDCSESYSYTTDEAPRRSR
jgi:hypothetical protein